MPKLKKERTFLIMLIGIKLKAEQAKGTIYCILMFWRYVMIYMV